MNLVRASIAGSLLLLVASATGADHTGTIFVDHDGDGMHGSQEPPLQGVRVSDGRTVVVSDADGRYALPSSPGALVFVTRPDGFASETWYREGSGDFGLRPVSTTEDFFFVQMSDAHVFDRMSDFRAYSFPIFPRWLPDWVVAQILLFGIDRGMADVN